MLKNYLKIAFRNLMAHKGNAFINIGGLSIGIAASLLMLLYVYDVLTYDHFHQNADHIYLLYRTRPLPQRGNVPIRETWMPLLPEIKRTYPGIVDGLRFVSVGSWIRYKDKRFRENYYAVDSSLFTMFSFPLRLRNPATVLADPYSVVVSEKIARKYFGDEDPIGKVLRIGARQDYNVTGILGDIPANSSYTFDLVVPLEGMDFYQNAATDWASSYLDTYVQLADGVNPRDLEAQFAPFVKQHIQPEEQGELLLLPLQEVQHRFSNTIKYASILLAIAIIVLLIASINFTNLTTARSMLRSREIGVRKVLGANRNRVVRQFLSESLLVSFIALLFGSLMAVELLPYFNQFVGMQLALKQFLEPAVFTGLLALGIVVGLLSGSYPALFLSKFQPTSILKRGLQSKPGGMHLRTTLVVVQFVLSVMLLIGIGVIYQQVQYLKSQNLRFDEHQVVVVSLGSGDFENQETALAQIEVFKNAVAGLSDVETVAASQAIPGRYDVWYTDVYPEGWESPLVWRRTFVDDQYFKVYGIEFTTKMQFANS